jgi:hypothetical protein
MSGCVLQLTRERERERIEEGDAYDEQPNRLPVEVNTFPFTRLFLYENYYAKMHEQSTLFRNLSCSENPNFTGFAKPRA